MKSFRTSAELAIAMEPDDRRASCLMALESEVHLWFVDTAALAEQPLPSDIVDCLAPGEMARLECLTESRSRLQYLVSRVLRRRALSAYWPRAELDWRFERTADGKPQLSSADSPSIPLFRFSLSHTAGLVACLITLGCDGGVDVERIGRQVDAMRLADRWFADAEALEIRNLEREARQQLFLDLWTLKESYMKARGLSSVALYRAASFELDEGHPGAIRSNLADQPAANASKWLFALFELSPRYRGAVCVHNGAGQELKVKLIQHDLSSGVSVRIDRSSINQPRFGYRVAIS